MGMLSILPPSVFSLCLHAAPQIVSPYGVLHGRTRVLMAAPVAPKTMGDAKRVFEADFGQPVSMSAQAFVNEVISSSVPAIVTPGYTYTRVFGLGLVSLCDEFLFEVRDDDMRNQIRSSLCLSLGLEPKAVVADAAALTAVAEGMSETELLETLDDFKQIAALDKPLKYTYTLGAGLIQLMNKVGVKPGGDGDVETGSAIDRWCAQLNLPCARTLSRDYAYYKGQQTKMQQIKDMFEQMKSATERRLSAKEQAKDVVDSGVPRELIA